MNRSNKVTVLTCFALIMEGALPAAVTRRRFHRPASQNATMQGDIALVLNEAMKGDLEARMRRG